MNDVVYWLCSKPVVGFVMLLSGLCVVYPPIDEAPISLHVEGEILERSFKVEATATYVVDLFVHYREGEWQAVHDLLGDGINPYCFDGTKADEMPESIRGRIGVQTPLTIKVLGETGQKAVFSTTAVGYCSVAHVPGKYLARRLATVHLPSGKYRLRVENQSDLNEFSRFKTTISLRHPGGK